MVSTCLNCKRNFDTLKGLNIHKARCKDFIPRVINCDDELDNDITITQDNNDMETTKILNFEENLNIFLDESSSTPTESNVDDDPPTPFLPEIEIISFAVESPDKIIWGNSSFKQLSSFISKAYDQAVLFRKYLFKIPSGKAGKRFINELCFCLHQFNTSSDLNSIALKTFFILPALLLQKPTAKSKAKEHTVSLNRRLDMWKNSEFDKLLKEVQYIQHKFKSSKKQKSPEDVGRIFAKLIMEGKLSAAIKLLDNEGSNGVLKLTEEVMTELQEKHPKAEPVSSNCLLFGPLNEVPEYIFDEIDEHLIMKTALQSKGAAGPSALDAEQMRRMLCSKNFSAAGKSSREEIAILTRNLLTKSYEPSLLEPYITSRLIPLHKNPGIRPIGIGESLRRLIGKTITKHFNSDIKEAAGPLLTCTGHGAGAEAAIHAMKDIFSSEETDGVLLIDASNAFNRLNRTSALHNIQLLCPTIAKYVINTYRQPAKLFIAGGKMILSEEGTTQGDPLAMPWYSICTAGIIQTTKIQTPTVHQVWLADDAAAAGTIKNLHEWYKILIVEGKKYEYFVNGKKSWLIVKSEEIAELARSLFGDTVNITTEGKRHLGAVIGSEEYKKEYCDELVSAWVNQLNVLSDFATTQPHAAYIAYTKGFKSRFTFFLRTICDFDKFTEPIEDVLERKLIPNVMGSNGSINEPFRSLVGLAPSEGGLGIPCIKDSAIDQYKASRTITKPHVETIVAQEMIKRETDIDGNSSIDLKNEVARAKTTRKKQQITQIDEQLSEGLKTCAIQARDKGASTWLNAIPREDQNYHLNKNDFKDAIRLRYNQKLHDLPSNCVCGENFNVQHALICKKGGFVSQRHDHIRDLLTVAINEVCIDVQSEPHLISLTGEQFRYKTANTSEESRLDIKTRGFWKYGQTAFFDIRVTHVNAKSNQNSSTKEIFKKHENAKKREYNERVIEVEPGSFTPLVFGTNGGMGDECLIFLKQLTTKIAEKKGNTYADRITWLRTKLSFAILKSVLLCVRGTRIPFYKHSMEDVRLDNREADI